MNENDLLQFRDTLIRIDERTQLLTQQLTEYRTSTVTRDEFEPVQTLVYGGTGLILIAVVSALIYQVIRKKP